MTGDRYPSRLDIDALPEVVVRKNSGEDLIQCINAYLFEKTIRMPKGTFATSSIVSPTLVEGAQGIIRGHGKDTIVTTSLGKFFDIANVAWIQGNNYPRIRLEDMYIQHNTVDANSITLDLRYGNVDLSNITLSNVNATRQGKAIYTQDSANPGHMRWDNVECFYYDVPLDVRCSHLLATRLVATYPESACLNLYGCMDTEILGLQVFRAVDTCKIVAVDNLQPGNMVSCVLNENQAAEHQTMLWHGATFNKALLAKHIHSSFPANVTVANIPGDFIIENSD
jgi:hypothetical protein